MTSASLMCLPLWVKVIQKMREETSSGGLLANDCLVHYSVSSLPFGGVGKRTRNSRPVITHATFGPFRHLAHGSNLGILSRTPPHTHRLGLSGKSFRSRNLRTWSFKLSDTPCSILTGGR